MVIIKLLRSVEKGLIKPDYKYVHYELLRAKIPVENHRKIVEILGTDNFLTVEYLTGVYGDSSSSTTIILLDKLHGYLKTLQMDKLVYDSTNIFIDCRDKGGHLYKSLTSLYPSDQ